MATLSCGEPKPQENTANSTRLASMTAISVLMDQLKLPTAAPKVMFTFLYLGGISTLHIAIPATLNVNTYNGTVLVERNTTLARSQ